MNDEGGQAGGSFGDPTRHGHGPDESIGDAAQRRHLVPPLDQHVGQLLIHQGLLRASDLPGLFDRARQRSQSRGGSFVLGAAVHEGLLSAASADLLLRSLETGVEDERASDVGAADAAIERAMLESQRLRSPPPIFPGSPLPPPVAGPLSDAERPTARLTPLSGAGSASANERPTDRLPLLPVPEASFRAPTPAGFGATPSAGFGAPPTPGFGAAPTSGFGAPPVAGSTPYGSQASAQPSVPPRSSGQHATLDQLFGCERYGPPQVDRPGWWRLTDRRLGRPVSMRLAQDAREDPEVSRSALLMANLDHSVVPKVHDLGERGGQAYFTQDPLEGQTLDQLLRPGDDAPRVLAHLLRSFLTLASGVEHAHERGVIHTRIGPKHVVLGDYGQVWLTGWGQAQLSSSAGPEWADAVGPPPPTVAPPTPAAQRAPEQRKSTGALDARVDVWGLGAILHWILAQSPPGQGGLGQAQARGVPAPLIAIANKALAARPTQRYRDARQLRLEVARYLDGERVEAQQEGFLGAMARLSRRHPLAAGIALTGAVVLLFTATLTLASVRRSYDAASADQAQALLSRGSADAALADVQAQADRAQLRRAFTDLLAEAVQRADLESGALVGDHRTTLAAFERAEQATEPLPSPDRAPLLRRLRRARAGWALNRAGAPDPPLQVALDDFRALAAADPQDEAAQLGRFRCARRLAGRAAGEEEQAALDDLTALGVMGPLIRAVREAEAMRDEDAAGAEALAQEARAGLSELLRVQPDLALAYELRGRAQRAAGKPGKGLGDLTRATRLDPNDPWPRLALVEAWTEANNLHQPWRWEARRFFNHIQAASALTDRPEPLLTLVLHLQALGLAEQSLGFTTRLKELQAKRVEPRAHAETLWVDAELFHVRASLASQLPAPPELYELELDAEDPRQLSLGLLRARDLLARRQFEPGFQEIAHAINRVDLISRDRMVSQFYLTDMLQALVDPRVDGDAVLSFLADAIPKLQGHPASLALHTAQLDRLAQAGASWPQLEGLYRALASDRAVLSRPEFRTLVDLAAARTLIATDARNPASHVLALDAWAGVNLYGANEPELHDVHQLLATRLERLGRDDLARQLLEPGPGTVGPLDEVWIKRDWVPDVLHTAERLR